MDDLYDNLDNFNEESTIAELQSENKNLKSKLEEYASTLEKLQNDFNKLDVEYKKLELNYSSLLKTAKAEIERKTQIIANLNLEKDKMILQSFQSKSVAPFSRSRPYDKSMLAKNNDEIGGGKFERDNKMKECGGSRQSHVVITERKENHLTVRDTRASPQVDTECKLLNMPNSGSMQVDLNTKNNDLKENVKEDGTFKSGALISNRRKSMAAASLETNNDDDDLASAGSSKEHPRKNMDRRHTDHHLNDKRDWRVSEASNLEDKNLRRQEHDAYKRRYSRYDSDKIDRYRTRDKSPHRHKKLSPDKYQRRSRGYRDDSHHRSENDRHRAKERVLESPPKDKYHRRSVREKHRDSYEKSHSRNSDKLPHQNQDRYPIKHKIQHSHDESDGKRMKIEQHFNHNEEEWRLQEERAFLDKQYSMEPSDVQFSSCESPDFIHPDVSTHQIREIKLTATTKLDDPRITNKKYMIKKDNGAVELSTAEGRNVDIIPINKIAWGIKHVNMPEALVQRPSPEVAHSAAEIYMEIENPVANISIESGEICDLEVLGPLGSPNLPKEIVSDNKYPKTDERQISLIKFNENKDTENSVQKISSYKIPKLKKYVNEEQKSTKVKQITPLEKLIHEDTPNHKMMSSHITIKDIEASSKLVVKPAEDKIKPTEKENSCIKNNNEVPDIDSELNNELKYLTAQEVVEGDLELSDDNYDSKEEPTSIIKENACTRFEHERDKDESCKTDMLKHSSNMSERVTVEPCKIKTTESTKKMKNKKKLRHKEVKEECKSKVPVQVSEKVTNVVEKESGTRKTNLIKTKFSELFDDSSSLISPEDLGLATVPASITLLPSKSVPFFEDALDAADLNTIKPLRALSSFDKTHKEENNHSGIPDETKIENASTESQESTDNIKTKEIQPEISKDVIESIYKNLEPGGSETEEAVKTVIISTGVQPQIAVEEEKRVLDSEVEPQKRTLCQEVALKALATSTPHKMWHLDAGQAEVGAKLLETSCSPNDSQTASVENSAVLDTPDANNLVSQTNSADVPDVRIFVRRKRKVIKK